MSLKLEVGKKYVNTDGDIVTLVSFTPETERFVEWYTDADGREYNEAGIGFGSNCSLVQEVKREPQTDVKADYLFATPSGWQTALPVVNIITDKHNRNVYVNLKDEDILHRIDITQVTFSYGITKEEAEKKLGMKII